MAGFNFNIYSSGGSAAVKQLNDMMEKARQVAAAYDDVNRKLATLRDRSAANRQNRQDLITQITGDPTKSREAFSELKKQLKDYERQLRETATNSSRYSIVPPDGPLAKHKARIRELTNEYLNLGAAQRKGRAGQAILNNIRQESQQINRALAEVRRATAAGNAGGTSSGSSFLNLIGNVGKLGLAISVVQKFTNAVLYAEETVRKFDAEVVNLGTILDRADAGENLASLERQALQLGQTTAFTAVEVVELQTALAKLGFGATQIQNMALPIVDFSVAVRESSERVAELTGAVLKSFQLTALDTRKVVDVLVDGVNNTALSFSYLETSLPIVASAARASNVSLEETTAVLGKLADEGVQASTAGTAFRNILIESAQRGLNFKQALDLINNSSNPLATAFNLFGKRGAVQGLILANDQLRTTGKELGEVAKNTRDFGNTFDDLGNRISRSREIAEKQLTSIQGRVTLLKSAWDGLLLAIANNETYKQGSKSFLDFFTNTFNVISARIDGTITAQELLNAQLQKGVPLAQATRGSIEEQAILIAERRAVENAINETLRDRASIDSELFTNKKREVELNNFIADVVIKGQKEYQKTGTSAKRGYELAKQSVERYIESVQKLLEEEAKRKAVERNIVKELTEDDIRQIDTIFRIREVIEDLTGAYEVTSVKSKEFLEIKQKLNVAREVEAKLTGEELKSNEEQIGLIDRLTSNLSKYEKQLKSTSSTQQQTTLFGNIQDIQRQLNEQEAIYKKFLAELSDAQLQLASKNIQKEVLENRQQQAKAELEIEKAKLAQQYGYGEAYQKRVEVLENQYNLKNLRNTLLTLDKISGAYQETLGQIAELTAKDFQLRFEIVLADANALADYNVQLKTAQLRKDVVDSRTAERELASTQLESDILKLNTELQQLKVKEILYNLQQRTGVVTAKMTDEEKKRKLELENILELKNKELEANNNLLSVTDSGEYFSEIQRYGEEVQELIRQYNAGEITDLPSRVASGESARTSAQVLEELFEIAEAKHKLYLNNIAKEEELAVARSLENKLEAKAKEAEIIARYGKEEIELTQIINQEENRRADILRRDQERRLRQTADAISNFSKEVGEALGKSLIDGDGLKEALKEALKGLIDVYVEYVRQVLTVQLFKSLLEGNFAQAAAIGLGIAGLSALSGAAKAAIDKFEYGGKLDGKVRGPSHVAGGVKARNKATGRLLEVEGDEFVVNKWATAKYQALLEQINAYRGYGSGKASYRGPAFMQDGGPLRTAPQVISPTETRVSLSDETLLKQAEIIAGKMAESQLSVLQQQVTAMTESWKEAMTYISKLEKRAERAEKNSRV